MLFHLKINAHDAVAIVVALMGQDFEFAVLI